MKKNEEGTGMRLSLFSWAGKDSWARHIVWE